MRQSMLPEARREQGAMLEGSQHPSLPGLQKAPPAFQLKAGEDEGAAVRQQVTSGGLPSDLVRGFANSSGHDLSDVQVHRNSSKPAEVGALAYAQGNEIHLGAGQEQHLAHEAAHVVQQREGRVKPTTMVGDMPVNDNASLESEADAMGARAVQMKQEPHAKQGLRSSTSQGAAQCKVAQRKVEVPYGSFDDKTYHLADGDGNEVEKNKKFSRLHIRLEFDAKDPVEAEEIGLVQTANTWYEGKPYHFKETHEKRSISDGPDEGTHIDQEPRLRNPLYAVQEQKPGKNDLNQGKTQEPFGEHGYHYPARFGGKKHKTAWLYDLPGIRHFGAGANSKQVFETTALVTKGKHKNLYLGSVKWGYQTDGEGKPELLPVTKASDGTPTGAFQEAAELWNGSQTTKGEGVVRLPIVTDVYRLREDKDLMTAPEGGRRRTQLPKGARVQPTGESSDGMVKVIVLDGSDTHTYQDGWITKGKLRREN